MQKLFFTIIAVKFAVQDGFNSDNECESHEEIYLGRSYSFHSL